MRIGLAQFDRFRHPICNALAQFAGVAEAANSGPHLVELLVVVDLALFRDVLLQSAHRSCQHLELLLLREAFLQSSALQYTAKHSQQVCGEIAHKGRAAVAAWVVGQVALDGNGSPHQILISAFEHNTLARRVDVRCGGELDGFDAIMDNFDRLMT